MNSTGTGLRAGSSFWNSDMTASNKTSLYGTLLPAGLFLFLASAFAEEPAKADFSGSVRGVYDYRSMGSSSDQDAYGYWYLRGRNLADKKVEIYTSGRIHSDLDGTTSSSYDPYGSIDDGSQSDIRLLQFYIDMHDPAKNMALRYGRQYVDVADYIQMDGAQAMLFENKKIGGRVFVGKPVSDYSSTSGDLFMGASLVGKPWEGNSTRATYARYQDDSVSAADDHCFLDSRQQISEEIRTRGYLSVMNEDVQMGGLDMFYMSLSEKVFDAVMGVRRVGDYEANTRVYSPMVDVLGTQEPYTTAYGNFTTQILSWFYLSPGASVSRTDEQNSSNRDYERYNLNFIFEPTKALSASVAVEYWDVQTSDSFLGLSGDLRYRYNNLWELSAGAAYVDYSYMEFTDYSVATSDGAIVANYDGTRVERSPNAYTYFLRGKWNISKTMALRLSGEIEDDSEEADLAYRVRTSFEVRL